MIPHYRIMTNIPPTVIIAVSMDKKPRIIIVGIAVAAIAAGLGVYLRKKILSTSKKKKE
jgi:hypothetical protein